eukprot:10257324-Lingulodinium_polyedra.AAC.1
MATDVSQGGGWQSARGSEPGSEHHRSGGASALAPASAADDRARAPGEHRQSARQLARVLEQRRESAL